MKPLINFINRYFPNLNSLLTEDLFSNISEKTKDHMFLYNYNQRHLVDRDNPILRKCRGLVVREDGSVLNYPFERFFNTFESECDILDYSSAMVQEKIDGSLISCFWNGIDWEVCTRGSFYPIVDSVSANFSEEFRRLFKLFGRLNTNINYFFELVSQNNRIVTWYDEESVYLIGARLKCNLKEIDSHTLDVTANHIKVNRPKQYKFNNMKEMDTLFDLLKDDEEGFVIVDNNFKRAKMKQESYIQLSRIKQLKEDDILDYLLGRIEVDEEYLQKDVEIRHKKLQMYLDLYEALDRIETIFCNIEYNNRKEFALQALKYPFSASLFTMFDNRDVKEGIKTWDYVKSILDYKEII